MNQKLEQLKTGLTSLKTKVNGKTTMAATTAAAMLATTGVTAFASTPASGPSLTLTEDMLKPISDSFMTNLGVILPVGLGMFGVAIAVMLVPKIITRFLRI